VSGTGVQVRRGQKEDNNNACDQLDGLSGYPAGQTRPETKAHRLDTGRLRVSFGSRKHRQGLTMMDLDGVRGRAVEIGCKDVDGCQ